MMFTQASLSWHEKLPIKNSLLIPFCSVGSLFHVFCLGLSTEGQEFGAEGEGRGGEGKRGRKG